MHATYHHHTTRATPLHTNIETHHRLLSVIEEEDKAVDGEIDSGQEENAITELNDVATLSMSRRSFKRKIEMTEKRPTNEKGYFLVFIEKIPLKGFILSLLWSIIISIATIFTKLVVNLSGIPPPIELHPFLSISSILATDVGFIRCTIQFIAMFIIVKYKGFSVLGPKNHRPLLLFRGLIGTFGLISFFFALKLLDPSDCITITQTSVIATAILARIFLKEKLTIVHIIAIMLTVIGVFFISKPKSLFGVTSHTVALNETNIDRNSISTPENSTRSTLIKLAGVGIALLCALSSSVAQVTLKKLSILKVHFSIILVTAGLIGLPICFVISVILVRTGYAHQNFTQTMHLLPMEILYASIGCSLGTLGQVLLNFALKYEQASKIAIYTTLNLFLTFISQYIILNIKVDLFSIIGSCSILLGTLFILSFKLIENRRVEIKESAENNNNNNK